MITGHSTNMAYPAERQFFHIYRRSDKSRRHALARDRVMDTFNNISVISWQSVLLVEEIGENHRPAQVTGKFYHLMLY